MALDPSGGVLLGVNAAVFEVQSSLSGEFFVKVHLKNKHDGFQVGANGCIWCGSN
jgi:hypothetical protein